MGTKDCGKNGENLGVLMFWGMTTMNQGKKTKTGVQKGQEIFWSYLGMKLSGPLDIKGVHLFLLIENKKWKI